VRALADRDIGIVGAVRFALARNKSGAFGLGGAFVPFLAVGAVGLVVVLLVRGDALTHPVVAVATGLVLGGALGNLADRLFRGSGFLDGAVVDFHDDLNRRGFSVTNPQAKSTCGCGSSFSM